MVLAAMITCLGPFDNLSDQVNDVSSVASIAREVNRRKAQALNSNPLSKSTSIHSRSPPATPQAKEKEPKLTRKP